MKSIGFVVLDKNDEFMPDINGLPGESLKSTVDLVNSACHTFGLEDKCPLRVVEAFINEE